MSCQISVPTPLPTLAISLTDPRGIPDSPVEEPEDDGVTEATVTSSGAVAAAAIRGQRVVVRVFPSLPSGIMVTLRRVDPAELPPVPGVVVPDWAFTVEAVDAGGRALAALPAALNLNVRYDDADGLDEDRLEVGPPGPIGPPVAAGPEAGARPRHQLPGGLGYGAGAYVVRAP